MNFEAWHYEIDTLPHFERMSDGADGAVELHIPVGVWSSELQPFNIIMEIWIDDEPPFRIGFDRANPHGSVSNIYPETIAEARLTSGSAARWYLEIEDKLGWSGNQYYEAVVVNIHEGARVRYTIKIVPLDQVSRQLGPYTMYAVLPVFGYRDIFVISDGGGSLDDYYALYYRQDTLFHYIRVDVLNVATSRLPFYLEVHNLRYSLSDLPFRPDLLPSLPAIDPFGDYVVVAIPKAEVPVVTNIRWRGIAYEIGGKVNVGRARVMFIHYCMQGLNDLFELPDKSYDPPRTYMQVTMRDELARYSSRPNSEEGVVGDGYLYTLASHREHRIPYLWTFNGGVLALISHDCPNALNQIKADIGAGILDPTIAGFGGHRLPYYQTETNLHSIMCGAEMVRNICDVCNKVYYPDQRLYKQTENVVDALKEAGVKYFVIDASTGYVPYSGTTEPNANGQGCYLDEHYVWRDRISGLCLLIITDELREKMVGSSDWEMRRGKLAFDLKRKFFHFAANPVIRKNHLMIYSDDADKASGNGWFDGKYSGFEILFRQKYDAALEWIAAHPWIQAITSADLDPASDCVGTIDMKTATCPSVDPGGITTVDAYGKGLHFDAWYDEWKRFDSAWLGQTLEEISQSVEFAVIDWPQQYRNRLYELGRMTFSMYLHESQWNKQPLEPIGGLNANQRHDVTEPEDFVISATLQLRNAQVYLNAAVWAEWVKASNDPGVYVNGGPVPDLLGQIMYQDLPWRDERYKGRPIVADSLHWDRDVLPNVVLYNREVLVVMDANGGRITHIFAIRDGVPYGISGTFKVYQFLSGERISGENIMCDGEVLQNTVYTPNHAYVACDVIQSRGVIGKKFNPKPGVNWELDCYYPDNFNAYAVRVSGADSADWTYEQTSQMPALDLSWFRSLLLQDREAKRRGDRGVVFHPHPSFRKRITLNGRTIEIRYFGVQAGHVVANEFCVDLNDGVMFAKEIKRDHPNGSVIDLSTDNGPRVRLQLDLNCAFTAETLQGETNRRLHRVLTDCLELTSENGGDFSYRIIV